MKIAHLPWKWKWKTAHFRGQPTHWSSVSFPFRKGRKHFEVAPGVQKETRKFLQMKINTTGYLSATYIIIIIIMIMIIITIIIILYTIWIYIYCIEYIYIKTSSKNGVIRNIIFCGLWFVFLSQQKNSTSAAWRPHPLRARPSPSPCRVSGHRPAGPSGLRLPKPKK